MVLLPPTLITLSCRADGAPVAGMLVSLTVVMSRKNDHRMILGPSDDRGEIMISEAAIESEMARDRDLFPMDYEDDQHRSGELIVEPMGQQEIEAALDAYEIYHASVSYPPGYRDQLTSAWEKIYQASFKRLEVTATIVSAAPAAASYWAQPTVRVSAVSKVIA